MNYPNECAFGEIFNAKDIFCVSCSSSDPPMLKVDVAKRDTVYGISSFLGLFSCYLVDIHSD